MGACVERERASGLPLGQSQRASCASAADPNAGTLVQVLAGFPSPPFTLSAVLPTGRKVTPKVRALIDFLVERFATADF